MTECDKCKRALEAFEFCIKIYIDEYEGVSYFDDSYPKKLVELREHLVELHGCKNLAIN